MTGHEKTLLSRQIETTDRQIDALVYGLYGLSEEEVAIVEVAPGDPRRPAGAAGRMVLRRREYRF